MTKSTRSVTIQSAGAADSSGPIIAASQKCGEARQAGQPAGGRGAPDRRDIEQFPSLWPLDL
jgi:hypothetical protein